MPLEAPAAPPLPPRGTEAPGRLGRPPKGPVDFATMRPPIHKNRYHEYKKTAMCTPSKREYRVGPVQNKQHAQEVVEGFNKHKKMSRANATKCQNQ